MPELCRFYNIIIKMIYSDNGSTASRIFMFTMQNMKLPSAWMGELLAGSLPMKQLKLVQAWAAIHEEELYRAWNMAVRNEPFGKIEPLR